MGFWRFHGDGVDTDYEFTEEVTDLKENGAANIGVVDKLVRADHVHPSDSTKAPLVSPAFTTPDIGEASGTGLTLSGLTASKAVHTNGSKKLVSVTNTGTGNNVLATSPVLTTPDVGDASASSVSGKSNSLVLAGRSDTTEPAYAFLRGNTGANPGIRAGKYGQEHAGQLSLGYTQVSGIDYTVYTYSTEYTIFYTAGAANRVLTLPDALASCWSDGSTGRVLEIKKVDSGVGHIIITPAGTDTIGGDATKTLYFQHESLTIMATHNDGWKVINQNKADVFGNYGAGNYSEFEADGTLVARGNATTWNDFLLPASNLRTGATPPTFALIRGGIYGYRFDAASPDEMHGALEIMHDYKEGTDLFVHVHWEPTTTNTGNIVWGFEYSVANPGTTFPATTTATMTPAAAPGIIGRHVLSNVVQIVGTGLTIGAILQFRVFRQNGGTDTFTGNAFLHSIGIHYESDTIGSRQITTK